MSTVLEQSLTATGAAAMQGLAPRNMQIDPTQGMELTTGDEIALEANRFLFLGMDLLDPYRRKDLEHLAPGGEELDNPCLRRTKNFLPRCTFTPLELWGVPMPTVLMPEGIRPLKLKGEPVEGANVNGRTFIGAPNFFVPMYPGEMIVDALGLTGSERKGIVEISCLRGEQYLGEKHSKLYEAFWANWPVPNELRVIQERIVTVASKYADPDIRSAADEMLGSIEASRTWADNRISEANTQVATRVKHEWTYSYSPRIRWLMTQLEVKPMYSGVESVQNEVARAISNSGLNLDAMAAQNAGFAEAIGASIAKAISEAFSRQQAVAVLDPIEVPTAPAAPAVPETKKPAK